MEETIKVERLTKKYGKLIALNELSLSVKRGRIFGLLGSNGAGKTTAIECMLGTRQADGGTVSILGCNPRKDRHRLFEKIGVQLQECAYQPEIRVFELCEETASLYKAPDDWQNLCSRFKLDKKIKHAVKSLSVGERQRLFIVLALISNPQVVFLDELTTGLDVKARRDVWKILSELKENNNFFDFSFYG